MKALPLGQQDFKEIIENNRIYVDKTRQINDLLQHKYYFFTRPRRFGKSLLVSTLKYLFLGENELFKGLWIEDKIPWVKHPVVHISFNNIPYSELGLEAALHQRLDNLLEENGAWCTDTSIAGKFRTLIEQMSERGKVVVLIDEYDKPIIDSLSNLEEAEKRRELLRSFYSVIKEADSYLRFFFITGVSRYNSVSLFSDINNLNDITLHRKYAALTGILPEEMLVYFSDYIDRIARVYAIGRDDMIRLIAREYLGYSWDGAQFVYNSSVLMNMFDREELNSSWYQSGTPKFLMDLIRKYRFEELNLKSKRYYLSSFDKHGLDEVSLEALLFETGYLTIKKNNPLEQTVLLDFPNKEVERAFAVHLLHKIQQ